jgi:hypothetical protein
MNRIHTRGRVSFIPYRKRESAYLLLLTLGRLILDFGDDIMEMLKNRKRFFIAGFILSVLLLGQGLLRAQEGGGNRPIPKGLYIELNKDFYEALKEEGTGRTKVYSNNPSEEYLRQIAISSRFIVETNLQIIRQQENMIELLQTFLEGKSPGKR